MRVAFSPMLGLLATRRIVRTVNSMLGIEFGLIGYLGKKGPLRALTQFGHQVVQFGQKSRQLRRSKATAICARGEALPIADNRLRAFVVFQSKRDTDWIRMFAELNRVVADRGKVLVVAVAPAKLLSRGALCGGLTSIRQHSVGRWVITSGLVTKHLSRSRPASSRSSIPAVQLETASSPA